MYVHLRLSGRPLVLSRGMSVVALDVKSLFANLLPWLLLSFNVRT